MKYYKSKKDNPFMRDMTATQSDGTLEIPKEDFEKHWILAVETTEEDKENIGADYHNSANKEMDPDMISPLLVFGDIIENSEGKYLLGFDYEYPEVIIT